MILHRIEETHFSQSEAIILDYILQQGEAIENQTVAQIAKATFTSAPLLVRIAHKLGFEGWSEFKKAFLEEMHYMYASQDIDASIPFLVSDDFSTIAENILTLHEETIQDTRKLLKHDDLMQALSLIRKAEEIDMYAKSSRMLLAESFMQKMFTINCKVNVSQISGDDMLQAAMSDDTHCAIVISYSGETENILKVVRKLKEKKTSIIAITSISDSTLSQLADVSLRISSREMLNTKIGDFASNESIICLLDILYACIFSFDYDHHLDYKISIAKEIEDGHSEYEYINEPEAGD